MGELYRKARSTEAGPPELVRVTMTLSRLAWAALKLYVGMCGPDGVTYGQVQNALALAQVVPAPVPEQPTERAWTAKELLTATEGPTEESHVWRLLRRLEAGKPGP